MVGIAGGVGRALRLEALARNADALDAVEGGLARLRRPVDALAHLLRRNTRAGSRRNIADHYDLGNDFFALMLDPTMTYSSGVWDLPGCTLEEAQVRKLDLLCRRLRLRPEDHLLEIGTGWGSLAIHAASRYGCRVTTTTLSRAQWELASERVRAAGLADRVTLLRDDYRDLRGSFDKVVSCEMIEAVGAEQYETFFARCASLLAPRGALALQAITIGDEHYERARREVDFIKRHVFPGSNIPSITALLQAATFAADVAPLVGVEARQEVLEVAIALVLPCKALVGPGAVAFPGHPIRPARVDEMKAAAGQSVAARETLDFPQHAGGHLCLVHPFGG